MKKIHHWKNKPLHLKVAITQHPLFIACKKSPLSVGIIIILLMFFSAQVFALPEPHQEVGIPIPAPPAQIEPLKAPKVKKIQYATVKAETATQPLRGAVSGDVWYKLRLCESGNDYKKNSGNGYYGAYQFSEGTWASMDTGYAFAHQAPPSVQDDAAKRLQQRSGWGQWPHCSQKLGLR